MISSTVSSVEGQNDHAADPKFDSGEIAWILACTAITWLMIPGVGFFYNGMARSKSSLSLIMLCLWSVAVVSIQWYIIGYSLCLSTSGGPLIGDAKHLFLGSVGDSPSEANPKIPAMLVGIWYCLFACITPTIIIGAVAERARFLPCVIFIFCWTTLVFDFLTYWTWNPHGWTYVMGALDYGGGTPVHISTGAAALAYAILVGKRTDRTETPPHNMTHVILGCSFIWFGWLVANAGSGISPNLRAVTVFITTNMSAAIGGITWAVIDFFRSGRQTWSAFGFCCGVVCGLVSITPASGYVTPSSSLVFGVLGALVCNLALGCKKFLRIDDAFDVFCVHGVGGIVGNLLTGVFAQKSVAAVDGTIIEGGWLDGNWKQVGFQALDTVAGAGWSFVVTFFILFIIDKIPGLGLRADLVAETEGLDKAEMGVSMYEHIEDLKMVIKSSSQQDLNKSNGNSHITNGEIQSQSQQKNSVETETLDL